jgi:hypothetical protein
MEGEFDPLFHQFLCGMLHQSLLILVCNLVGSINT